MNRFHFYDQKSGLIHDAMVMTDQTDGAEEFARRNAPPGHLPIAGDYDHLSQRVDVATGSVVDYQPPAPSTGHVWNAATKRWQLNEAAALKLAARAEALAQIAQLEAAQPRAIRDFLFRNDATHLHEIDQKIAALRASLT